MGSEGEASNHTGGLAVDGDPTGRRQAEPTRDAGVRAASASQDKEVSGRGAPGSGWSPRTGPSGPEIKLETTRDGANGAETPATPGGKARFVVGTSSVETDGPYHSTRRGWKQQELPGGGPVRKP